MEIQSYFRRLDLKKLGAIDFGSKISYLIRSDISGYNINVASNISEITSSNYPRRGKFYGSLLAKYTLGSILISDRHRFTPSYTFSYSFNRDVDAITINSNLINHIFEMTFITDLLPKK